MGSLSQEEARVAQKTLESYIKRKYGENLHKEEWRNLPELPTAEEIMPKPKLQRLPEQPPVCGPAENWDDYQRDPLYNPKLPINKIDGPWESKLTYIGSHYQLLREDAIAALRRAVGEVHSKPDLADDGDTCIYTHVTFVGLQLARIGVAFRVAFSTERAGKQIRWEQSRRLLQGTLVALSPARDKFRTICKLAVIADRPLKGGLDQDPPTVDLFWADPNEAVFDPLEKYMMVEAREGYYEASRHTLVALQKLTTERTSTTLVEHIAFLGRDIQPPRYLQDQPYVNLTALQRVASQAEPDSTAPPDADTEKLFNVDAVNDFPSNLKSTMDASQLQACRNMLTRSVAIIQGPPGTGKTFTSVSAIKVMMENLRADDPPLIIAAQTNHALDQLLNHIMAFDERIVRLGGRTEKENAKIRKRTLYELRVANPQVPFGRAGRRIAHDVHKSNVEAIKTLLNPVLGDGIMSAETLLKHDIFTQAQRDSLFESEDADADWDGDEGGSGLLEDWIGNQLMEIPKPPQVDQSLPLEEEDITYEQAQTLAKELNGTEDREGDAPLKDEDDNERLRGDWFPFMRKYTGKHVPPVTETRIRKLLEKTTSLNKIAKHLRGEVYRYWEKKLDEIALKELRWRLEQYQSSVENYQVTTAMANLRLVRHLGIKVIGCTTTGLAKYRGFLSAIQPRTLLIEEAAESLEGTIMGGLVESLQQLILVGDHQQLQAHCTIKALEDGPYNLKVSMFERLIKNGLPYVMLNKQRRMIPEIRKLLCIEPEPFYKDLQDHESVLDRVTARPHVPGMGGRDTYFFHHSWPEARSTNCSRYNPDEAEMMAGVFHYLVCNGVDPAMITVLTFYNGQRRQLINELQKRTDLYGANAYFKVFTVDSYQGEENDIVLLSLVRSNGYLNVGFLDNRNRLVVALSRARRGLYIFGNTVTLTMAESNEDKRGREPLWNPLINFMRTQGRYSLNGGFPITCTKHRNTIRITDPISWFVNSGGCEEKCDDGPLQCGHPCPLYCHPYGHERVICKQACPRVLSCGHGCSGTCSQKPCHCSMCAIAETPDGRPMFNESDAFSALDLEMHKVLYEKYEVESEAESPVANARNILPKRNALIGHNKRITSAEAPRGQGSQAFSKRGNGQSRLVRDGRHPSDSSISETARDNPMSPRALLRISQHAQPSKRSPSRSSPGSSLSRPTQRNGPGKNPSTPISQGRNARNNNTSSTPVSTPQAWRSWDAKKADEEMNEMRRLEKEMSPAVDRSTMVFNEIYRPITVENGFRQRSSTGVTRSVIRRSEPGVIVDSLNRNVTRISSGMKTVAIEDTPTNLVDFDDSMMIDSRASTNGATKQGGPVSLSASMLLIDPFRDRNESETPVGQDLPSRNLLDLDDEPPKPVEADRKYSNDLKQLIDLENGSQSDFTSAKAGPGSQNGKSGLTVAQAFAKQNFQSGNLFKTGNQKGFKPNGKSGPQPNAGTRIGFDQQSSVQWDNSVVKQSGANSSDLLDLDEFLAIPEEKFHAAPKDLDEDSKDLGRPQSALSLL